MIESSPASAPSWGVVFDVDGVLAHTEPASDEAARAVFLAATGIELSVDDITHYLGSTAPKMFGDLCARYAPDADVEELCAQHTHAVIEYVRNAPDLALPGAASLLDSALDETDCRVGLATGSARSRSEATIAACKVSAELLDAWITGDDIARPKPDPVIYAKPAAALDLDPCGCVAIEDSPAGVASAKAAGMSCVGITNSVSADQLSHADRVIASLGELCVDELRSLARGQGV